MARLILDTGAVLGFIHRDIRVAAALRVARLRGDEVVVPAVVVAQVIRGGDRDASAYRLFNAVHVASVGLRLARVADELLGAAGMADAVDALVVAEAPRVRPSIVLTGDPSDLGRLLGERTGVTIVPM